MKIVAAGVGGLIGTALSHALPENYALVRLKRDPTTGTFLGDWKKELEGSFAVINLCGEPLVGKRWTPKQKQILKDSRLSTTKALVGALAGCRSRPKVFLNASAIGFYGPRGVERLDEDSAKGKGFLADLADEWEAEALKAGTYGVRTVTLRSGIVLAKEGGALKKMLPPFKMFVGGPLGGGRQILSWIHIEDEVNGIVKAMEDTRIKGPVNLTAPNAVSMKEFAKTLGEILNRPAIVPVPGFVLKGLLGEMAEVLLEGQNVYPKKLIEAGFPFKHGDLKSALKDLLGSPAV